MKEQVKQKKVWEKLAEGRTVDDVVASFQRPCLFQKELSDMIAGLGRTTQNDRPVRVCEVGCDSGVGTFLLPETHFSRYCLDSNQAATALVSESASRLRQRVHVCCADMFSMPYCDDVFDITFSAGVLEHYSFTQRQEALRECARVTRSGGKLIVAVPNHYSFPYWWAYHLRRLCKAWPYPKEERVKSLKEEIAVCERLEVQAVRFLDKETLFSIQPKARMTALVMRVLDVLFRFQGYLRVIVIEKRVKSA